MNERIIELWSQAEEEIKAEYEDESRRNRRLYNEIFLPKFAELIIKDQQRTWVGLTDKEILADDVLRYYFGLNGGAGPVSKSGRKIVDVLEAKLKEKNT